MAVNSVKVQANVDQQTANEANAILDSLGLTPTSAINALYKAIVNQGGIPFDMKLSREQQLALEIQKAADDAQIPTTVITSRAEFEQAWKEMDREE